MLKTASLTVTSSYQSLATILDAQTGIPYGPGRNLSNGLFRNTGTANIRLSTGNTAVIEGNDDVSILMEPGDALAFTAINFTNTFAKTTSGTGALDIYGEE